MIFGDFTVDCNDFSIIVDRENSAKWQGLGFPKGSKYLKSFSVLIVHLKGYVDYITTHYERALKACPVQQEIQKSVEGQSLTLEHIQGVSYVCYVLLGMAAISLALEYYSNARVSRH